MADGPSAIGVAMISAGSHVPSTVTEIWGPGSVVAIGSRSRRVVRISCDFPWRLRDGRSTRSGKRNDQVVAWSFSRRTVEEKLSSGNDSKLDRHFVASARVCTPSFWKMCST